MIKRSMNKRNISSMTGSVDPILWTESWTESGSGRRNWSLYGPDPWSFSGSHSYSESGSGTQSRGWSIRDFISLT